jgi:apolipoprotein N-acyltransferase
MGPADRDLVASPRALWRRTLGGAVCVLSSSAAWFLSTGGHQVWPLAWFAPFPVLLLAFESSAVTAIAGAFLGFFLGSCSFIELYAGRLPMSALMPSLVVLSVLFALIVALARFAVKRVEGWAGVLAFPLLWTSCEYLFSLVSPNGTAGSLAYTQADVLPVIQVASVTGLWGITFLLTLVPSALAVAWHRRRDGKPDVSVVALPVLVLLVALIFGWMRLANAPAGERVRVGLAASDATVGLFETEREDEALRVVQAYVRRIEALAARGAKLVVLPEKFVGIIPSDDREARGLLADVARRHGVWVVAGFNEIGTSPRRNTALVLSPEGRVVAEYEKVHLVPVLEAGYRVGTAPGRFAAFSRTVGVAICKDMDFPALGRRAAASGVGLMAVPAWDFVADGRFHSRMALMRGVEGGFSVARTAQQGLLTASDDRGRVVAEEISSQGEEVLLTATLAVGTGRTFYARAGDCFAWLATSAAAALLGWAGTNRRQTAPEHRL